MTDVVEIIEGLDHPGAVVADIVEFVWEGETRLAPPSFVYPMRELIKPKEREELSLGQKVSGVIGMIEVAGIIFDKAADPKSDVELPESFQCSNLFTYLNLGCQLLEDLPAKELSQDTLFHELEGVVGDLFKGILFRAADLYSKPGGASKVRDLVSYWQRYERILESAKGGEPNLLDTSSGVSL